MSNTIPFQSKRVFFEGTWAPSRQTPVSWSTGINAFTGARPKPKGYYYQMINTLLLND
jgi:hypothetical protein